MGMDWVKLPRCFFLFFYPRVIIRRLIIGTGTGGRGALGRYMAAFTFLLIILLHFPGGF